MPENPFDAGPGFMGGFADAISQSLQRHMGERARREQQERDEQILTYRTLLQSGNPQLQAIGLTGMLEKPQANFWGKLKTTPTYTRAQQILSAMNQLDQQGGDLQSELPAPPNIDEGDFEFERRLQQPQPPPNVDLPAAARSVAPLPQPSMPTPAAPPSGGPPLALPATSPTLQGKGGAPLSPAGPSVAEVTPKDPLDPGLPSSLLQGPPPAVPMRGPGGAASYSSVKSEVLRGFKQGMQQLYGAMWPQGSDQEQRTARFLQMLNEHEAMGTPLEEALPQIATELNPQQALLKRAEMTGARQLGMEGVRQQGREDLTRLRASLQREEPVFRKRVAGGRELTELYTRGGDFIKEVSEGETRLGHTTWTDPETGEQREIFFNAYGGGGGAPRPGAPLGAGGGPAPSPAAAGPPGISRGKKSTVEDRSKEVALDQALNDTDKILGFLEDPEVAEAFGGPLGMRGKLTGTKVKLGMASPKEVEAHTYLSAVSPSEIFSTAGKVLSQQEWKLLEPYMPSESMTSEQLRVSLGRLKEVLERRKQGVFGQGAGAGGGQPKVGQKKTFPNGRVGVWDGQGWAAQ